MNHYIFQAFKITKPATLLDSSSSTVAKSCLTPLTKWIVAGQAPLSMEFSRQEYRGGLPFPSPGDLPNPGIEPRSPALQADTLTSEPPGYVSVYIAYYGFLFNSSCPILDLCSEFNCLLRGSFQLLSSGRICRG